MTQPARTDQNAPGRPGTTLVTGLMLFALFFGAGNLIFPPAIRRLATADTASSDSTHNQYQSYLTPGNWLLTPINAETSSITH